MADHGLGHHNYAVTSQAHDFRQFQAVTEGAKVLAKATKFNEGVVIHQDAGATDCQHVNAVIVLALVDLAGHDLIGAASTGGNAQTHL